MLVLASTMVCSTSNCSTQSNAQFLPYFVHVCPNDKLCMTVLVS
jgi:hypothetical protein